jgi:hypothetical protein
VQCAHKQYITCSTKPKVEMRQHCNLPNQAASNSCSSALATDVFSMLGSCLENALGAVGGPAGAGGQ